MSVRTTTCLLPECGRSLSFLRRFRGYEYCCPDHFIQHRQQRQHWAPVRDEGSSKDRSALGRRAFAGAVVTAGVAYLSTRLESVPYLSFRIEQNRKPQTLTPPPAPEHVASFDFARPGNSLNSWKPLDPGLALHSEHGQGLTLDGSLLYSPVPQAASGLIDLAVYLESGSTDILLAYDAASRDHTRVRLTVDPANIELRAFSQRHDDGAKSNLGVPLVLSREGRSRHDLSVRFDSGSILARWGSAQTYWNNLKLAPGSVGLSANPEDHSLLLGARLALRA